MNSIDLKKDRLKCKKLLKKCNFAFYANTYLLCKNKKTNVLYLAVTTINNDIVFLKYSNKELEDEQIKEIFSEYDFNSNAAGGFNMFPGFENTIYGYSDKEKIILGNSCQIWRF